MNLPPISDQPHEMRIRTDQHSLIILVKPDGNSRLITDPSMVTPDLLAILAHLYSYYSECCLPRPPRPHPSPHYRPMPRTLSTPEDMGE